MLGPLDGLALAFAVATCWPSIRIIVASGQRVDQDKLPEESLFLDKPYSFPQLTSAIDALSA